MHDTTVTAFGASFSGPTQSSAVLRARASALGLAPRGACDRDLVAAVVAAHCWMIVLRRPALAAVGDQDAAAALAAVYCRATGHAVRAREHDGLLERADDLATELASLPTAQLSSELLARISDAITWATYHSDADALVCAAEDLSAGAGNPAIVAACSALLTAAEELLAPGTEDVVAEGLGRASA